MDSRRHLSTSATLDTPPFLKYRHADDVPIDHLFDANGNIVVATLETLGAVVHDDQFVHDVLDMVDEAEGMSPDDITSCVRDLFVDALNPGGTTAGREFIVEEGVVGIIEKAVSWLCQQVWAHMHSGVQAELEKVSWMLRRLDSLEQTERIHRLRHELESCQWVVLGEWWACFREDCWTRRWERALRRADAILRHFPKSSIADRIRHWRSICMTGNALRPEHLEGLDPRREEEMYRVVGRDDFPTAGYVVM